MGERAAGPIEGERKPSRWWEKDDELWAGEYKKEVIAPSSQK